jgi:hypothetical protein
MQDQFEYLDFVCVPDCIKSAVIIYYNLFDQRLAPWARLRVPPNDLQCHKTPDERQLQPLTSSLFALVARVIGLASLTLRFYKDGLKALTQKSEQLG